jgi:hypothetical protein
MRYASYFVKLMLLLVQVKVKRRGDDKKYIAKVNLL